MLLPPRAKQRISNCVLIPSVPVNMGKPSATAEEGARAFGGCIWCVREAMVRVTRGTDTVVAPCEDALVLWADTREQRRHPICIPKLSDPMQSPRLPAGGTGFCNLFDEFPQIGYLSGGQTTYF